MTRAAYEFTSESVSEGHPDKVCDRISRLHFGCFFGARSQARVAVETLTTTNLIVMAGEVRPEGLVSAEEMEAIAREAVKDIGYEQGAFTGKTQKCSAVCTPNRRILRKASTAMAVIRMRVRVTKVSCSVMPAAKPRN